MMSELALVAKATLILCVALALTRVTRRARASVRSLILASAFGLVLVLPVASILMPPREVEIPASYAPAFLLDDVTQLSDLPPSQAAPPVAPLRQRSRPILSLRDSARLVWAAGGIAALVPLVAGLWRVRGIRRRARGWDTGGQLAVSLGSTLGIRRRIHVVRHDTLVAPMACGWMRPTIAMPDDATAWSDPDLRRALLHELEHVRRHDWPVHVLARATCALYWFHPAAWMAWRQLALESERACDDAVVAGTEDTAYAEQLVSLARRLSRHAPVPLLSMADRRMLSMRVSSILNNTVARGRVGAWAATVILVGSVTLAVGLAPVRAVGAPQDTVRIPLSTDGPGFEVVSVKPNHPEDRLRVNDWQPMTGRLTLRNLTPQVMLTFAYAPTPTLFLPEDQFAGVPEWAERSRFTIEAVAGRPVSAAEMQRMLRRVLVERFGLRVHLEQRERSAYRLVAAHANGQLGPNLRPADLTKCKVARRPQGGSEWGPQPLVCTTIDLLSLDLSERLGRPVINQTGLDGLFDGTLSYSPSAEELAVIYHLSPSELPPAAITGPSLTTALQEQLGLKLEPTRAAIDVLVVDTLNQPTPNDAPELSPGAVQGGAPARPAFEVASVRRNTSGSERSRGPIVQPGNRLVAENVMARSLITTAYGLRWEQVLGGPGWLDTDHWDVEARAPETAALEDVRAMLRTLLAERFGLVARRETRQQDLYAVMPAGGRRSTPGLRTAAATCTPIRPPARLPFVPTPDSSSAVGAPEGEPVVSLGSPPKCQRVFFPGFLGARQIGMPEFAASLTMFARRPVIDKTEMTGEYDIDLTFSPDPAAATGDAVSLFTALQEQLGLKLEATRGPVDVLVIDGVTRPQPN